MYDNIVILANIFILISSIFLVFIYGDSKKLKISFSMLSLGSLSWLITLFLYYLPNFENYLLLIGKSNFVGINIATVSYYFFIKIFTQKTFKLGLKEVVYILISLLIFYLTLFTDHIILKEIALPNGERGTIFGNWYYIYIIKILSDVILSFVVAIRSYKTSPKEFKSQIKIFLFATFLGLLIGGFTNLILPQFSVFTFQRYGIFGLSILNLSIVYLIVKYQFLNIKILLGQAFYYIILMIIVIFVFFGIEQLIKIEIFTNSVLSRTLFFSTTSFIFVFLFTRIIDILKKQVRTQFINPGYDPYDILEDFNKKIARLLTVEKISTEFSNIMSKTLRPSKAQLLLVKNTDNHNFYFSAFNILGTKIIDYEKFQDYFNTEKDPEKRNLLTAAKNQMNQEDLHLIISLEDKEERIALLLIGRREIDSVYSQYDKEFLLNLSQVISLSLARAFLHEEVENFNKVLQNKVDIQTNELKIKVKQLEEARQKENDMIDIMGHELRTPATIVKLNVDFLHKFSDKLPTDRESFLKYISRIRDAIDTEIMLINTLLTSAKLSGDKIELNPEKVDVYKQVDMALHSEEETAKKKGVDLINYVEKDNAYVYADHARVAEILYNLISNAVRYTDKGSVTVSSSTEENFVKTTIRDTGRGISKNDIPKLGTKFFRTKTYIESKDGDDFNIVRPGGTGLGLYVTFGLVRKMGGRIDVQSKVGQGSTFTVSLPKFDSNTHGKTEDDGKDMFKRLGLHK